MKRTLFVIALVCAIALGVTAMREATETRPDVRDANRTTEVVVHLESQDYLQSLDTAAQALWGACSATIGGELAPPGIERIGDGDYRYSITPSLGQHGKERLLGCFRDLTVDRVRSRVESVHTRTQGVSG